MTSAGLARMGLARMPKNAPGWFFGHLLDGAGGSRPLAPWDAAAARHARRGAGAWVHLDFRDERARGFIADCAKTRGKDHEMQRRTHVSNLMVADPRKTQPRCEVSAAGTGMLLSLVPHFGQRFEASELFPQHRNLVPFRMWLGRGILITARGHQPDEGAHAPSAAARPPFPREGRLLLTGLRISRRANFSSPHPPLAALSSGELRLPSLSKLLDDGNGPATCGALASHVISEITAITADSALAIEDEIFELQARLQRDARLAGARRPVRAAALQALRSELTPLRYAAISVRRYRG